MNRHYLTYITVKHEQGRSTSQKRTNVTKILAKINQSHVNLGKLYICKSRGKYVPNSVNKVPHIIMRTQNTRCDQKVLGMICFSEIHWIKIFVSRSFDLIEGHWKCEKHAVMLGCLCKALLIEDRATYLHCGKPEIVLL